MKLQQEVQDRLSEAEKIKLSVDLSGQSPKEEWQTNKELEQLEDEIVELQRRNAELEQLLKIEDDLLFLQVCFLVNLTPTAALNTCTQNTTLISVLCLSCLCRDLSMVLCDSRNMLIIKSLFMCLFVFLAIKWLCNLSWVGVLAFKEKYALIHEKEMRSVTQLFLHLM